MQLGTQKKQVRISFAYWKSASFAEKIGEIVNQLKNVQFQIILGSSSIEDPKYIEATKIIARTCKSHPHFQAKVLFCHRTKPFAKMHWKYVSVDRRVYYIGS